jgi:hypothetical protein
LSGISSGGVLLLIGILVALALLAVLTLRLSRATELMPSDR